MKVGVRLIRQDSRLVISLITLGGGVTRTKYMHARMNLKYSAEEGNLKYTNTKKMAADGASKSLDGSRFQNY